MIKTSTLAIIFTALLLICFSPVLAHAQGTTSTSGVDSPDCNRDGTQTAHDLRLQQSLAATGQKKIQAINNAQALFAPIDVKIQSCFANMQAIFMAIGMHGDPLNLIFGLVATEIMNLLNQVCAMALSDLQQLATYAMSQLNRFCLPLPDFGLGGGSLGLKPVTCNGVSLLQPGGSKNGTDPINFTIQDLFPQSSQ